MYSFLWKFELSCSFTAQTKKTVIKAVDKKKKKKQTQTIHSKRAASSIEIPFLNHTPNKTYI